MDRRSSTGRWLSGLIAGIAGAISLDLHAAEVEAMVNLTHGSDLARGCPQDCSEYEPQYDALTGGVTITAGRRQAWEIDLSHGFKWVDRGPREGASQLSVRFYPGRFRRDVR